MDADRIKDLIGPKHRPEFDPADPIFLVVKLVEEAFDTTLKTAMADIEKVVTGFVDQVSSANVLANNTAKAKAETTVTAAAQWAAEHLKAAGVDAGKLAAGPVEEALEQAAQAARTATIAAWIGCASAVASAVVAVMVFLH